MRRMGHRRAAVRPRQSLLALACLAAWALQGASNDVDLIEAGAISGKRKTMWKEKMICTFALGSQKLYDFINRNVSVEVHQGKVVNDPFVMGAWARDQKSNGKIRMLADGSAAFAQAAGMVLDLTARGLGLRSQRYSMLVKDGKVATLNVDAPGKYEVSDGATLLAQAKG